MRVRTIVWAGLGMLVLGLALWVKSMPGLHTTPSGTRVSGCEGPRGENSADVCPRLFCQKALRDRPEIGDRAEIELTHSFTSADGGKTVHAGTARWIEKDEAKQSNVRCLMKGDVIVKAGPITAEEFSKVVYGNEEL